MLEGTSVVDETLEDAWKRLAQLSATKNLNEWGSTVDDDVVEELAGVVDLR